MSRYSIGCVVCANLLCLAAPAIRAQDVVRDTSIDDLPRPGYEPRAIAVGSAMIAPSVTVGVVHDDNIFATRGDTRNDAIFSIRPAVAARRERTDLDIKADVHAELIRYASYPRENVNTFGATTTIVKPISSRHSLSAEGLFDRGFQRRSDPEANLNGDPSRSPALINLAVGSLQYRYRGGRFGVIATASIESLNYLPAADANRDLTTYRGSARMLLAVAPHVSAYVEPFVNRRSFRIDSTAAGVFGNTTTIGTLGGVSFDLASRLEGNLGVGVFSANPDTAGASTYTGVAASGRLTWHPRTRTAATLSVFRGDVATIRAGSLARIDTRIGVGIDQEARHNLLLHVGGGYRRIAYRGGADSGQRYVVGNAEARYLLNRNLAASLELAYTHRTAALPEEKFERLRVAVGLRYMIGRI